VAIVQISRIQVRRGQKNVGSGVPQLAGGEFGWAVDTRELFIGNGSVSEGSPAVGNSKVLTEHDNLFSFADQYSYQKNTATMQTGATAMLPVARTLQDRLDEKVSVKSFGALGDGSDQTEVMQRAIDQLYLNSATKGSTASRVTLEIPAGEYLLSASLKLPPYATIVGAGQDKVKITQGANTPIFETVNSGSTPGSYAQDSSSTTLNQAQHILLKGMTLVQNTTNTGLHLVSCKESRFEDLIIHGGWTSGTIAGSLQNAIKMDSLSTAVSCNRNKFENIKFKGYGVAVKSDFDVTENTFDHCEFDTLKYGVYFGENTTIGQQGMATGPVRNVFSNCEFHDIDQQGIFVHKGNFNSSSNNRFISVGNNGGNEGNATHSIIKFTDGTALSNSSTNDWFDRTGNLSYDQNFISGYVYVPEVEGPGVFDNAFSYRFPVTQQNAAVRILRCPGYATRNVVVEYIYKSSQVNAVREGKLDILVNLADGTATLTDDYSYLGGSTYATNIEFSVALADENSDATNDTVVISMKNTTTSDTGDILFNLRYKT
tara:strand:- start:37515 stop:39143 length:1629 start_codon:yes stop_codon:yes gene_type:complete